MTSWAYADIWETIAGLRGDAPTLVHGERVISWSAFDARADALAARLLAAGLSPGAKVAAYLYNGPEYLESYFAAFKAGFAPVNTNYRYGEDELFYLFDNADAEAIVFHAGFAGTLEPIRARLAKVKLWIAVDDEGFDRPDWAEDYEAVVAQTPDVRPVRGPGGRSGDDLLLLYTGGTTGLPKGVMWRQDDLFNVLGAGGSFSLGVPALERLDQIAERHAAPDWLFMRTLVACPLMHGTGQFSAFISLSTGGMVATTPARKFDAAPLWGDVERLAITNVIIVGPAFALPMLEALEAEPGRWDLSGVRMISSSGAFWPQDNKAALLRHLPEGAVLFDSFGSSEAVGLGGSTSSAGAEVATARFELGPTVAVFNEAGARLRPGSGERGLVAISGFIPLGYYKDPEKTAKTFQTFEGQRWSVPGDFAEVEADGTLKLLGRGSQCINTGGEKVFPEEVEEALKTHAAVRDAVVVGVPDARFGEKICAVVELQATAAGDSPGPDAPSLDALAAHVREHLAPYKAPRELVTVETVGRAPNGKVDYKAVKARAMQVLFPSG